MPLEEVFEGNICGYDLKMILNSQGLVFFLWHPHRRRCYQARIPYLLQGKSLQIQNVFTNLDEFFIYFTQFSQDRDRIFINEKGTIRVAFVVKKTKKMTPPIIYIDTQVLITGTQMKEQPKLHRQISDVKRQNLILQSRIDMLTKLNEDNRKEMEELKEIMYKSNRKYDNSSSQESQQQENQKRRKKRRKSKKKKYSIISGGKDSLNQLNDTVQQLGKDLQLMRQKIHKPTFSPSSNPLLVNPAMTPESQYLSEAQIFGEKMHITVDLFNKFIQSEYRVEGNKITKIRGYGRYQLLSKETIPLKGRHYFVIHLDKISHKLASFGIVNQSRRNYQNSHESPELISYFPKTGAFWEYNPRFPTRSAGPKLPNNMEIRVVVDMDRFTLKLYGDKKEFASTTIQQHLRKERMVAYMEINYEGDTVWWNQKTE